MTHAEPAASPVDKSRLKGIYKSLDDFRRILAEPPGSIAEHSERLSAAQSKAKRLLASARDDGTLRRLIQNNALSVTLDQKLGELERIICDQASVYLGVVSKVVDEVLNHK